MRLKSKIWVQAFLRICVVKDASAVVVRHGDDDAGALFVKIVIDLRTVRLYGPAPAGSFDADRVHRLAPVFDELDIAEPEADAHIAQQVKFDPDLWLVEVERCSDPQDLHAWLTDPPL
ncbi:MAG: DUF1491 family protein [Pseudomonadota bacterium]